MSIFDSLLSAAGSNVDISQIAERVGVDPATAQQAVAALAQAHTQDGDTLDNASAQTGLSPDMLSQIVGHLGGEGALGQIASTVSQNPQLLESVLGGQSGGIGGMLGGFLGRE